jgi:hypothetical protein
VNTSLIAILIGIVMLLFGRRLFWFFVAGAGFMVGAWLAAEVLGQQEPWVLLAAAGVLGIIGALLALLAQKIAVGVAGFLGAGYVGHVVAETLGYSQYAWIVFIVAGVVGAIILISLFDWALVVLSSLTGAAVVADNVLWENPSPAVVFLFLLVVGLAVQASQFRARTAKARDEK